MAAHLAVGDATGSAVLAIDLGGQAIYCNGAAETIIGRPLSEIIGRSYEQIFKLRDVVTARGPVTVTAMDQGSRDSPASVLMVLHSSGFEMPIVHRSSPIRARDGQISGAMITFRCVLRETQAA